MISKKIVATTLIGILALSTVACGNKNETPPSAEREKVTMQSQTREEQEKNTNKKEKEGFQEDAKYSSKPVSFNYGPGTITVGTDKAPDDDHIYLNIKCSEARDGYEIGYYVESSRVDLQLPTFNNIACDVGENATQSNFVIRERFYADVAPSTYVNKDYFGVRWQDNIMYDNRNGGTTISIRAVNLKTGALVTMCDATISYDKKKNTYSITSLKSSEVAKTKELTNDTRDHIVKKSAEFAASRLHCDVSEFNVSAAICDKHDGTYFSNFLGKDDAILYYKDYITCHDTYAITLPSEKYGYITVYYAPQTQLIGLTSPTEVGSTDLRLKLYGYDPVFPQDPHTLLAPDGFLY